MFINFLEHVIDSKVPDYSTYTGSGDICPNYLIDW